MRWLVVVWVIGLADWASAQACFSEATRNGSCSDVGAVDLDALLATLDLPDDSEPTPSAVQRIRPRERRTRRDVALPDSAPQPATPGEEARLHAAGTYLCAAPDAVEAPRVRFEHAALLFSLGHLELAAYHFGRVAQEHPEHPLALTAGAVNLESLAQLSVQNEACLQQLAETAEAYAGTLCAPFVEHELCDALPRLQCNLRRREAEALATQERHHDAAAVYLEEASRCEAADEFLYNAAIHFEAAGELLQAIEVRRSLTLRFPESVLAKRALWQRATNHDQLAMYAEAAQLYVDFGRHYPGEDGPCDEQRPRDSCINARAGLARAVALFVALNDHRGAANAASHYATFYGRRLPEETAHVTAAAARIQRRPGPWFQRLLRARTLPLVIELEARLALARTPEDLAEVTSRWEAAAAAPRTQQSAVSTQARALAGEAFYRQAEQLASRRLRAFQRLTRDPSSLRQALDAVHAAYQRVVEAGSPRWTVAAMRQQGELALRALSAFGTDGESTDSARQAALTCLTACFQTAMDTKTVGEDSEACASHLHALDPQQAPPFEELVGPPQRSRDWARPRPVTEDAASEFTDERAFHEYLQAPRHRSL